MKHDTQKLDAPGFASIRACHCDARVTITSPDGTKTEHGNDVSALSIGENIVGLHLLLTEGFDRRSQAFKMLGMPGWRLTIQYDVRGAEVFKREWTSLELARWNLTSAAASGAMPLSLELWFVHPTAIVGNRPEELRAYVREERRSERLVSAIADLTATLDDVLKGARRPALRPVSTPVVPEPPTAFSSEQIAVLQAAGLLVEPKPPAGLTVEALQDLIAAAVEQYEESRRIYQMNKENARKEKEA